MRHRILWTIVATMTIVPLVAPGCAKRSERLTEVATVDQQPGETTEVEATRANDQTPLPRPSLAPPGAYQGPPLKPPQFVGSSPLPAESVPPPAAVRPTSSATTSGIDAPAAESAEASGVDPYYVPPTLELPSSRLIRRREEWTEAETAADALGRIGEAATPELIAMLDDADPRVRRRGAEILARIGPDAEAALEPLIRLLEQDPDLQVRKAAAFALGQMGPKAAAAAPILSRMLREASN